MKLTIFMIFPILWNFECLAMPLEGDDADIEVTPYPNTQKRIINDINNPSPDVTTILRGFNLSLDQINAQRELLKNRTKDFYEVIPASTYPPPTEGDQALRLKTIAIALSKTLRGNNNQMNAEFEYILPALCEVPKHTNLTDWFGTKSWNIYFKPNYRQYNVKSVKLRLFKVPLPNTKVSKECDPDAGEFYKVTISIISRKRKEVKRRIIFAQMIQSSLHDWIEIDVNSTLKFWESLKNNYGLTVDIFDKDDIQMDAKEHFHLQNCEADAVKLPWGIARSYTPNYGNKNTKNDVEVRGELYIGPRLDIISSTTANYNLSSEQQNQQSSRHQRHTHGIRHHHHLIRSNEESVENSDSNLHRKLTNRRDHSHRSDTNVEET